MTDDIPIYISPEDDITSVRERLEKAPNRQVTLVIPAQTQLRSLVAWRVLHADARKMGKDVLVISTDPQIRSLAQAGKFRVAHSQASSTTGKSRQQTRPSRGGTGKGRFTSSQARMQAAKKPSIQLPPTSEDSPSQWPGPVTEQPPFTQRNAERPFTANTTGNLKGNSTFSPSLDELTPEPGRIYDLHPHTTPSLHSVSPDVRQEDTGSYWAEDADFDQAEDIRNSAKHSATALPGLPQTPQETVADEQQMVDAPTPGSIYRTTPLPEEQDQGEIGNDFFPVMNEAPPASTLHEQRGSAVINGLDTNEHALPHDSFEEYADEIDGGLHVEDLGEDPGTNANLFDSAPLLQDNEVHDYPGDLPEQEQQEKPTPSPRYNASRSSRRVSREFNTLSSRQQHLDKPFDHPPIEDRPTVIIPPEERSAARARNSAALNAPKAPTGDRKPAGKRASQQILVPTPRTTPTARPRANVPTRAGTNAGARRAPAGTRGQAATTKKLPERSSRRSGAVLLLLALLLVLLIGIPAYFVPSADVTLKLPAKSYSHPLSLKAVANIGQKTSTADIVPADQLTNDFEATGSGKATSSTKVGTAPATGTVTFTNNGKTLVTIPSGTVVATSSGITFATQAEAIVDIASSNLGNTVDMPIQAQKSGTTGNVAAGSITTIPPDGLNAIAMANKMNGSDLKLTVTNTEATTSGGAGTTPAISQQDIDAAKASLHTTLDKTFKAWLATKVSSGDVAGTLTTAETLENAPTVGQPATDGTFTAKLKLSVVVLIVRSATLQQATVTQLNSFVKQDKKFPNYAVVDDAKHPVLIQNLKTTSDNNAALTLAFTALGSVVPSIDVQTVRNKVNGKSIKDAQTTLLEIPGVHQVDIHTAPQIGSWTPSWVPFWSSNIAVHLIPEDATTPPKK